MRNFLAVLLLAPMFSIGQSANPEINTRKSRQLFEEDRDKPAVLLLGVFHFAGEKVDANTTPSSLRLNMLAPDRQEQISQLVKQLAEFHPTKIAIEADPVYGHYYDSIYKRYRQGLPLTTGEPDGEIQQLAFRLAGMLNHDKVYPVNAQAFRFSLSPKDSITTFEKYKDQGDSSYEYWEDKYDAEKKMTDTFAYTHSLQEYLQYLNSDYKQSLAIGRWLVTTKRGSNTEPIGADGFITRYFNRNVRIYSNIQRIVTSKKDRILVIYGATHIDMLKLLFTASPEFRLYDIAPYLK